MTPELTATLVALLAIVIAAVALYQARQPLTVANVSGALQKGTETASELTEVALVAVRASEQLWRTGRIQRDQRLTKALNYTRQWFPDLNDETLLTALESAVLVVNTVVDSMPKKPTA